MEGRSQLVGRRRTPCLQCRQTTKVAGDARLLEQDATGRVAGPVLIKHFPTSAGARVVEARGPRVWTPAVPYGISVVFSTPLVFVVVVEDFSS